MIGSQGWIIREYGRAAEIETFELVAGADEVIVEIAYCGLNHSDLLMQNGTYQDTPDLPFSQGMEFTGIVRAAGADVDIDIGARVLCLKGFGGLARHARVRAQDCFILPENTPLDRAAALVIANGTAALALGLRAGIRAGDTVLVTGASGGAGLAAIRYINAIGASPLAVVSKSDKAEFMRELGIRNIIIAETGAALHAYKDRLRVDALYDTVGGSYFENAIRLVRAGGHIIPIGFASGEVPQIAANYILVKNLTVHGVNWSSIRKIAPHDYNTIVRDLLTKLASGTLDVDIARIFSFADTPIALDTLASRRANGRLLINCQG